MPKPAVLIVDDHELFRKGLEFAIKKTNLAGRIRHACNGNEALQDMSRNPAELVFMDIHMPEMDGIRATAALKVNFPACHVIGLSMMDDRSNILQMFRAGCSSYLFKDTNSSQIAEAMETVLSGKKYFTNEVSQLLIDHLIEPAQKKSKKQIKADSVRLSERELNVLKLICQQFSSKEIADLLNTTEKSINNVRQTLLTKTDSRNLVGLVTFAIDRKIIHPV